MLEYFAIKKFRKSHHSTPSADGALTPLLTPPDERFLAQVIDEPERMTGPEGVIFNGPQPPQAPVAADAPAKTTAAGDRDWKGNLRDKWGYLEALGSTTASRLGQVVVGKGKDKEKRKEKGKEKATEAPDDGVEAAATAPTGPSEAAVMQEDQELTDILERLNCAAVNGTMLSSSAGIKPLIGKFTQIFKDLINGVPTAYDDLVSLFESSSSFMEKTYSSLPDFIKQIIQTMPDKMTPAVLRTLAATSPAAASASGLGLKEIVTAPGVLAELLKGIVQVLRTRFPILLGGGVAVGLGVFVLFFVLWYCFKRGKETREAREEVARIEALGVEGIAAEEELEKEKKGAEKKKGREKKEEVEKTKVPEKGGWWRSK